MADVLLELGDTNRVESSPRISEADISPLQDFVDTWENPAVKVISPDAELPPEKTRVLARMRAVSAAMRAHLVEPGNLPSWVKPGVVWRKRSGSRQQSAVIAGLSDADCERVWKCFPSLKPFDKRDFERCKEYHPEGSFSGREGIYPLPSNRANFPNVLHGDRAALASFRLGGLSDFFKKIGDTVTSPMGLSVLGAASGVIPWGETTGRVASVALSGLTKYTANKYDIDPKLLAQQVSGMASLGGSIAGNQTMAQMISQRLGVKYDPKMASDPVLLTSLVLKSAGQFSALNELARGAGKVTGLFGSDADRLLMQIQASIGNAALAAGRQDVLSSGAAAGTGSAVGLGLERGAFSEFPVIPVAIGGVAAVAIGVVIAIASR